MTTAILVIQAIQAALAAAPGAVDVITKAKAFVESLFNAGVISKAQQEAIFAHVESIEKLVDSGIVPSHWQVVPTPVPVFPAPQPPPTPPQP